jgi:hypothetical protein
MSCLLRLKFQALSLLELPSIYSENNRSVEVADAAEVETVIVLLRPIHCLLHLLFIENE